MSRGPRFCKGPAGSSGTGSGMSLALPNETPIACVLREGRVQLGGGDPRRFPQPRMADLLGVSLRQYQRWERGASRPSARAVERIERALSGEQAQDAAQAVARRIESLEAQLRSLRAELDALHAQRG